MNRDSLYAFYGTLRKGMDNYHLLGPGVNYIRTVQLPGYKLYSLVDYPYAVKSNSPADTIIAELFYVPDLSAQEAVRSLELDAGYYYSEALVDGDKYGIYLLERAQKGHEQIISGDWALYIAKN